jgi:hypothetical protein
VRVAVLALGLCGCDFIFTLKDPSELQPPGDGAVVDSDSLVDGRDARGPCEEVCPPTYTELGVGLPRYLVNTTLPLAFGDNDTSGAAKACVDSGAGFPAFTHLLVFDDQAEFDQVRGAIDNSLVYWIGHRRTTGENFEPITDQPHTYPPTSGGPWGAGEPDGNDCAALQFGMNVVAESCTTQRPFICECDCFAPD